MDQSMGGEGGATFIDGDPGRGRDQRGNRGRDRDGAETGPGNRLGRELSEIAAATFELAHELRPMLDHEAAAALDGLVRDGENDACRIAVIGQVKAGKSTLINALIRRPGFLPTDVNPWTAVVTNLHFGRSPDAGAVYQFFDDVDWQHLAAGGRLFELSRRLGIELDAYMLASHVRQMRERAEQRLGPQFQLLLGKQHRFAVASADVLERYVCIGDLDSDAAGGPAPDAGRFADVTKSADLYFDLDDPFACAVTIVDTPGTNDPFLVRDEISRDALKSADAYVVVLNAQRALSSSDLDLLRLLHGLQKSRLVVFVNRIDLLNNPEADGAAVAAHIRSKLASEFPGTAIPVIAGSAMWAQSAAMSDEAAIQASMARRRLPEAAGDAATWRARLTRASGLGELAMMLSRLIARGPAMLRLRRRQNALRDMVSKLDLAMRGELLLLERRVSASSEDERAAAQQRAQAAETLRRINAVSGAVTTRIETTNADLQRAQSAAIRRLDAALRDVIRRHAAAARNTLAAVPRFSRDHIWRYPTLPLRQELERTFQKIYWEAAGRLRGIERTANAEILGQVGNLVPANDVVGEGAPIHSIDPEPSISALGQTLAVELDSQWRAWWRLRQGHKQQAEELEQILLADLTPVVDALVSAAETEIAAHVSISIDRFAQVGRDLVAMLDRRKLDAEAERRGETMEKPQEPANEHSTRQKQLEQSTESCARIADALKLLMGRSAALGPAAEAVQPG
jgi:tRNA U34 5-carboxymethylaminomethyl modifying GTPase MnmE/TrmE